MPKITRVVVPIDEIETANFSTQQAVIFAKEHKVDISIIAIDESPQYLVSAYYQKKIQEEKKRLLTQLKNFCRANGVHATTSFIPGDPVKEIVNHVTDHDLLVMTSTEKKGYQKLMLGNISKEVLRHAPCSVMIVKSQNNFEK